METALTGQQQGGIAASLDDLVALRGRVAGGTSMRRRLLTTVASPGAHVSRHAGRGLAFAELRAYQPGDEPRHIDWRHTARRGRPFTKLFEAERERPLWLLVDQRQAMRFGTRGAFKSVQAARAAAVLAWTAAAAGDRVGGALLAADEPPPVPPRAREAGVLPLLAQLCAAQRDDVRAGKLLAGQFPPAATAVLEQGTARVPPDGRTGDSLAAALLRVSRLLRPGAELIVIGDFADFDAVAERALARLAAQAQVSLLQVFDLFERDAPPPAVYRLTDGEREVDLDLCDVAVRAAWGAAFRERSARLAHCASRLALPYRQLATDEDPLGSLAVWSAPASMLPARVAGEPGAVVPSVARPLAGGR
jgi:uncharacterized protein (DUF58 family)